MRIFQNLLTLVQPVDRQALVQALVVLLEAPLLLELPELPDLELPELLALASLAPRVQASLVPRVQV